MAPKIGPVVEGLEVGKAYRLVAPQKLPLGGKVSGKRKPGLFRVYVPARDGGRLTLEASAGEVEVFDPAGAPAEDAAGKAVAKGKKVEFDIPLGSFGWYGVLVNGAASYDLSSKFVIAGHSKDADGSMLVPWNFFYFPYANGSAHGPAKRWEQKFGGKAFAFEAESFWRSEIDSGGRDRAGKTGHSITEEFVKEYNEFVGREVIKYADCDWWGHCDAAAAASAIFTQPKPNNGFSEDDLEWAATEIAMRGYSLELKFFLGGLTNSSRNHPSHKEVPKADLGQSLDGDIGPLHEAVVKAIGNEGSVVLMDFRANFESEGDGRDSHVWNQCVYKFEIQMEQAEDDGPGKDEEALARRLKAHMTLFANSDTSPSLGNPESNKGSGWDREVEYVIHFDDKGKVDPNHPKNNAMRCTWARTGQDYFLPRYMFKIKGLGGSGGLGNPEVSLDDLRKCGVTQRKAFEG